MEWEVEHKIKSVLTTIGPSLGGADLRFKNIKEGIVTIEYYKPLSNPSACHVDRTQITKDIVIEVLEEQLEKVVPGFIKITLISGE